ncbi:uncharacterized protein M421DRAFT_4781 [Didymella exigua CBS 183.55]|uniref:F-box domain-containing protein n=1 Tax=Didymella exigua CBS 183.55 TaxID=1150837 RepID=A0A6A5RMU7_9PLEO|nr:uncharacterized protein M421DRAFT_4781 [Didymella exigua CBS 183.55]KAF1928959.1 hypothetical protein M421DRAFT_4781 [Didymella exigua CBS 183.55]
MLCLLPDELLLQIALYISNNKSQINLALTHRNFRNTVYESLIRTAIIPIRSIPQYITLLSRHPSWANTITDIELQDSTEDINDFTFTPEDGRVVDGFVSRLLTGQERDMVRRAFTKDHQSPLAWTSLLFVALPNAKTLRAAPRTDNEIPEAYQFLLRHWACDRRIFWTPLLTYAQSHIQALTVRAPSDIYDPIGVSHLVSLKILIVDGECLRPVTFMECTSHWIAIAARTRPFGSLPRNLENLHIYGDEQTIPWHWLLELQFYQLNNEFGSLIFTQLKLRLFFNITCKTLARFLVYKFEPGSYDNIDALRLLQIWQQSAVDFQTLFRDPKDGGDAFDRPERYIRGNLPEEFLTAQTRATEDVWYMHDPQTERRGEAWRRYLEEHYSEELFPCSTESGLSTQLLQYLC